MRTVAKKALCMAISLVIICGIVSVFPAKITADAATAAAQKVVSIAKNEVGYKEGSGNVTKYGSWYGAQVAWCGIFVAWCFDRADDQLGTNMYGTIYPKTASSGSSRSFFINRGEYYKRSSGYTPAVGDLIYFNWQSPSGAPQHIGIVTGTSGSTVYTVEGNSSDMVRSKSYSMSSSKILGYAHPSYPGSGGSVATTAKNTTTTTKKNTTATTAKTTTTTKKTTTTTTAAPNPSITLNTTNLNMRVGKSVSVRATTLNMKSADAKLTWSSSKTSVATVDQTGKITAISDGEAVITVKSVKGITAQCKVTVTNPTTGIFLNYDNSMMYVGTDIQLDSTIEPENTTDKFTWESSDEEIATVSNDGLVTAVSEGTATITVESSSGKTASCEITVEPKIIVLQEIVLDKSFEAVTIGDTFKLNATTYPEDATEAITWESSNEEIVTVSQEGEVVAVGGGSATITITSDSGTTATCIVTVKVPADSLYFEDTSIQLALGQIYNLNPIISQDTTDVLIWNSSDFSVVVVSPDGELIAIGSGTATITLEASGGTSAECVVTVN